MFNFLSKFLVLIHTVLSLLAMSWAIMLFFQNRDFGKREPHLEVTERDKEGKVKSAIVHASDYDKSAAAVKLASETRDRVYAQVAPAIDAVRAVEPYLSSNQLVFVSELIRLDRSDEPIEVRRLEQGGAVLEHDLGKPKAEAEVVPGVSKSYRVYWADYKKLHAEIKDYEPKNRKLSADTKKLTAQLTGTDEDGKYVHPGLYQLIDLEFNAQGEIRKAIDAIKQPHSQILEQARVLQFRHDNLRTTLEKLEPNHPLLKKDVPMK